MGDETAEKNLRRRKKERKEKVCTWQRTARPPSSLPQTPFPDPNAWVMSSQRDVSEISIAREEVSIVQYSTVITKNNHGIVSAID